MREGRKWRRQLSPGGEVGRTRRARPDARSGLIPQSALFPTRTLDLAILVRVHVSKPVFKRPYRLRKIERHTLLVPRTSEIRCTLLKAGAAALDLSAHRQVAPANKS